MEKSDTEDSGVNLIRECPEIGNRPSFTPRGERREKRFPIGYSTYLRADVKSLCEYSFSACRFVAAGVQRGLVYRTPIGRNWMLMRGPTARAVLGIACSQVR